MPHKKFRGIKRTPVLLHITAALALTLAARPVHAQNGRGPEVSVKTSPAVPAAGAFWTLSLLIDHPSPEEVTIMAPPFTDALFLDQVIKIPVEPRKTLAEYRFILNSGGPVTLEPFTVITPRGSVLTAPVVIPVQTARSIHGPLRPRLAWEGPAFVQAGMAASFKLRTSAGDSPRSLQAAETLMPEVPPGLILEPEELSPQEKAAGLVFSMKATALEASVFDIPPRTVSRENVLFEIPALRFKADPAPVMAGDAAGTGTDVTRNRDDSGVPAGAGRPPFPDLGGAAQNHPVLFKTFGGDFENICRTARNLWERGYPAEALAELRRNERDHPAGALFAELRREAEQSLGLFHTSGENRRSRKWPAACLVFLLIAAAARACFRLLPAALKKGGALFAGLFLAAGLTCLLPAFLSGPRAGTKTRFGVARETPVRRVPDPAGQAPARFKEGQPLRIGGSGQAKPDGWVWAEANGEAGEAGWIPADRVVFY